MKEKVEILRKLEEAGITLSDLMELFSEISETCEDSEGLTNVKKIKTTRKRVFDLMKKIGASVGCSGYRYWAEVIQIYYECKNPTPAMCKDVYQMLAKKYDVSYFGVERAMRQEVIFIWKNKNEVKLRDKIFNPNLYSKENRPSNKEFLAEIVTYMMLQDEE